MRLQLKRKKHPATAIGGLQSDIAIPWNTMTVLEDERGEMNVTVDHCVADAQVTLLVTGRSCNGQAEH